MRNGADNAGARIPADDRDNADHADQGGRDIDTHAQKNHDDQKDHADNAGDKRICTHYFFPFFPYVSSNFASRAASSPRASSISLRA